MVTSPHPYNRSNTRSTAHKYSTAVDQPCFHSFASLLPSGSGARSAAMLLIAFFNNSSKARTHSSCECLYSRTTTGAASRPLPLIASSPKLLREAEDVPVGNPPQSPAEGLYRTGNKCGRYSRGGPVECGPLARGFEGAWALLQAAGPLLLYGRLRCSLPISIGAGWKF